MFTIRRVEEKDQAAMLEITREVGVFTQADVECMDELLQTYLYQPDNHDYTFGAACDEQDRVLGYVCFGPTPLTEGTYDIYWLAVSKAAQGQGVGSALFLWIEPQVRALGGRLLVLETSGTPEYEPARRMYQRLGYIGRVAVPDFYRPGDDLVIFSKPLR